MFNQKELSIIKYGIANGKTKDEVKEAIGNFRLGLTGQKEEQTEQPQSYLQETGADIRQIGTDIKSSISQRASNIADIRQAEEQGQGGLRTAFQSFGQTLGGVSDVIGNVFKGIVKTVLPQKAEDVVKGGIQAVATPVMESELVKGILTKYNSLDEATKRDIDSTLGIGTFALDVVGGVAGVKALKQGIKTTGTVAKQAVGSIDDLARGTGRALKGVAGKVVPQSDEIMNRVARLKPTDFNKFKKISGKTPGQYLVETGNFGPPDKILAKESTKFIQSLNSVDDELAKLPGFYKSGATEDALTELVKKAKTVSTKNIKAPYLDDVLELKKKYDSTGLSMEDINSVKRLYERKVKLGYNKLMNADKVEQATNIDNALRKWQVTQAKELGFENISELNKQTQISKFLIDKLGDQVIGQSGLNGITLTDWIILSGGNPANVGGFITKKFLSSKGVQARIAEMLNKGAIKGQILPKITPKKTKGVIPQTTGKVDDLATQAKKFESADEFYNAKGLSDEFRNAGIKGREQFTKFFNENVTSKKDLLEGSMAHRPSKSGIASNIEVSAPDFYSRPNLYDVGGKEYTESIDVLQKIRNKPNSTVTIYRASPKNELRTGDWVTFSKEKARLESIAEGTPIQSFKVKVKDVQFAGDDITEFGYWGKS